MSRLDAIADPIRLRIVRRLSETPAATLPELARAADVHLNTVRPHVAALEHAGVLTRERQGPPGRGRAPRPAPAGAPGTRPAARAVPVGRRLAAADHRLPRPRGAPGRHARALRAEHARPQGRRGRVGALAARASRLARLLGGGAARAGAPRVPGPRARPRARAERVPLQPGAARSPRAP